MTCNSGLYFNKINKKQTSTNRAQRYKFEINFLFFT